MNISEALRDILSLQRVTQSDVAKELGVSQPAIASVLSVGNPQFRVLNRITRAVGYNVVLAPADTKLPESCYLLDLAEKSGRHA